MTEPVLTQQLKPSVQKALGLHSVGRWQVEQLRYLSDGMVAVADELEQLLGAKGHCEQVYGRETGEAY